MQTTFDVGEFVNKYLDSAWAWFSTLSREEWLIVLAVTCAIGFILVRSNFGIRSQC